MAHTVFTSFRFLMTRYVGISPPLNSMVKMIRFRITFLPIRYFRDST